MLTTLSRYALFTQFRTLFRQDDGPLTQRTALHPSPVGAAQLPGPLLPEGTTTLICGYCSIGCGLEVHLRDGQAINLSATPTHPVNRGSACPKGWEALTPLAAADRATTPLQRESGGKLRPIEWQTALDAFTASFKRIQAEHGPESVAFLSTGQMATEEMALLGALAKFGMGMLHGDGNTRQCMATAVLAYKQAFGFDAPGYTYKDFEESDVIVFVGANPCIAHPILWARVAANPHNPAIVVVDPRRTETAEAATHHYPVTPKGDLALFYGLAHILIANGWIDLDFIQYHANGFAAFREHLRAYTPERVSPLCGLSVEKLHEFARLIHQGKRVSFWWTMGVNQSHQGVATAQAIINLALLTGNIGRPGAGANSITGQCNAMGSRLFSNTTNLLGGHDFKKAEDREKVAGILGIPVERIPDRDSLPYHRILEGIDRGEIRGLWVIATNPAHSWIDQTGVREILAKLDYLVVQDMYHTTETAQMAHLLLPAAGWGEKEGTFINSERRIGLLKRVARAPGQALADFYIFKLIADAWGCGDLFAGWSSPEAVFSILKQLSAGQPCDITGIQDYRFLDSRGGVQWPLAAGEVLIENERRLYADGRFYHPDGRARLCFADDRPLPEAVDGEYPFALLTGRGTSAQWHTQTRTGKSAVLAKLYPSDVYVEMHPADAHRLHIQPNEWVAVRSRRGEVRARAVLTPTVQPGQLFMAMHYPETNRLTQPIFDPISHQPAYKHCAVAVGRG